MTQPIIWIFSADPAHHTAATFLASRLHTMTDAIVHLATIDGRIPQHPTPPTITYHSDITRAEDIVARAAKDKAAVLIWVGAARFDGLATLKPTEYTRLVICNLSETDVPQKRLRWFATRQQAVLTQADHFFALDQITAEKLTRLNIASNQISAFGPLQKGGVVPEILGDLDEFQHLKGRPQWSAVFVDRAELGSVLSAHKAILRENHRMLLLLAPADPKDEEAFKNTIDDMGMRVARRLNDDMPDNNTAVLLADGPDEFARWLSMAPVTFLGQSLAHDMRGNDPMVAASFGVAVLYGPHIADYLDAYSQLATAGAARIVRDADSLATAVLQVSNPQLAAQMGFAAWDYLSAGAEATDAVVAYVQNQLDNEVS